MLEAALPVQLDIPTLLEALIARSVLLDTILLALCVLNALLGVTLRPVEA
jgi:hypothetical protein